MIPRKHRDIVTELLSLPTAPFAEHHVADYVTAFCRALPGLTVRRDEVGNILVRVKNGKRRVARPVCITAHLDHPGFVADRMTGSSRVRATWRGGVPKEYFVGSGVRFFVDGKWVKGTVRSIKTVKREGRVVVDTAQVAVGRAIPQGSIGMWNLPEPAIRNNRLYARACDDLAGVAAMLCAIQVLRGSRLACEAYFLFTRAEEVGFIGAMAAAKRSTIPRKCLVVAMETSSERVHAKMGDGPILRVGDKASVFTPAVTAWCHRVAQDLARKDKRFIYQRRLMDGGTCESSAYCALGYDATGLCLALGHYHNLNVKRKKIASEYIDLSDFANVVRWFVELARTRRPFTGRDAELDGQLARLQAGYNPLLSRTAVRPGRRSR